MYSSSGLLTGTTELPHNGTKVSTACRDTYSTAKAGQQELSAKTFYTAAAAAAAAATS
jgi:hypothetical protein